MAFFKRATSTAAAVQIPAEESENYLKQRFTGVSNTFQEAFQDRSIDVSKRFIKRSWNVRASRKLKNNRLEAVKFICSVLAFLSGLGGTMTDRPAQIQLTIWLISLAALILFDGLHFFDRFFSIQSRAIISASAVCYAAYVYTELETVFQAAGIITGTGLLLIIVLNKKWLSAENWLMTEAGQRALLIDCDNEATRQWQAAGRRETRSMLYSLGLESSDNSLDIIHRPIWLAGYLSAEQKLGRYRERMMKLEARAKEAGSLSGELEESRAEATRYYQELKQIKSDLAHTEKRADALAKDNEVLANENAELRRANEELCEALKFDQTEDTGADPEGQERGTGVYPVKTDLERLLDYIEQGYSQTQAGKLIGVSKATASRMVKEARESGQIPAGHPAAQARPNITVVRGA